MPYKLGITISEMSNGTPGRIRDCPITEASLEAQYVAGWVLSCAAVTGVVPASLAFNV